eukprot:TRINITY_DN4722_c0_g1_i1.p1 TRINITY_DN4722_c0_g1~~TRINITY_DN4722_c0_g1_i1.p1  ORF type:complete len:105 (-),score=16.60 TRINITY_DN4722_c0_g1_i1:130-444(-)
MIRRPPRSTLSSSSAASDVYKRQEPFSGTGKPLLSLQSFYTEAIIASKQRFKIALIFETATTIRKITLVMREKSVCRAVAQRIQVASRHARNEGAVIVQTLLGC